MGGPALDVTWIGHATALVVIDGLRVLTDPALTPRLAHLRRHHPVDVDALAPDVVLISHLPLDHLHLGPLRLLTRDPARPVTIVVPAGSARLVRRAGFTTVHEARVGEAPRFRAGAGATRP